MQNFRSTDCTRLRITTPKIRERCTPRHALTTVNMYFVGVVGIFVVLFHSFIQVLCCLDSDVICFFAEELLKISFFEVCIHNDVTISQWTIKSWSLELLNLLSF